MIETPRTLYDKVWDDHVVDRQDDGTCLLYIDRHLVHEVTSPQAFEGLRMAGRKVHAPERTLAVVDHNVPTTDRSQGIDDPESRVQIETLAANVAEFGVEYFDALDPRQGIVHIIGPEQGFTLPGTTIVCGDSHTSTHGAFGALAQGIGTSEVEHVLATQTLIQRKARNMRVSGRGRSGARRHRQGHHPRHHRRDRHRGRHRPRHRICRCEAIRALSLEGRMTMCNMSIEGGARAGMVAPDDKTFAYLQGRPRAPDGASLGPGARLLARAVLRRRRLLRQGGPARCRRTCRRSSRGARARRTSSRWPARVPRADEGGGRGSARHDSARALDYMGLKGGEKITDVALDKVFIGSCTNGRIEDLRAAARIVAGHKVAERVSAMVVPGSGLVKAQAEAEGLDLIFKRAGFEWREPGCSMCLGMNPDKLTPGQRCASTSNRNFEGRQGPGGRTHLVSPAMAAAAAVAGRFVDVRNWR